MWEMIQERNKAKEKLIDNKKMRGIDLQGNIMRRQMK
jgi:hypothetical protein